MEEQKSSPRNNIALSTVLTIGACVLLSGTSIASFFYVVPLVILGYFYKDTAKAVLLQILALVLCICLFAYQTKDLFVPKAMGYVMLSGYMLVAPGVFSILYTALREWSSSVLRKVVASSIAVVVLGLCLCIWLSSDSGSLAFEGLTNAFKATYEQFGELGLDVSLLTEVTSYMMLYAIVPIGFVMSVIPLLAAETGIHRFDQRWQSEFAFMKMPNYYAYGFIALIVATFAVSFSNAPVIAEMILWNVTITLGLHYVLNGMSLFFFYRRRNNQMYLAGKLVLLIVAINFIPFVGLLATFALLIMGLLEAWINFR